MDTIFHGDLTRPGGRRLAWIDALFVDHAVFRLVWTNFAAVEPGVVYRCNHPTPGRLAELTRRYGLKTLINLRGQAKNGSDALSREMAQRLGLEFHDMALESRGAPQKARIERIAGIFERMEKPAIMHCKSGADRAGLASALFVLLNGGTGEAALRQLSWRFGHFSRSKTGILDAFVRRYMRDGEGRKPFLQWVREDYDEEALRRDFRAGGLSSFLNDRVLRRE